MGRAVVVLPKDRAKVHAWAEKAPAGTRVIFQGPQRSLDQNSRLWAMLTDISSQLLWHGQHWPADAWKDFFVHSYRGARFMPAEDGGYVPIGRSTSQMTKEEMGELQDLIEAFASRHGVALNDETGPGRANAEADQVGP